MPQVLPIPNAGSRRSYTPNLQGDPVAVVMEFLSETEGTEYSIRSSPPYGKMYFYETILQVPTYLTLPRLKSVGFFKSPESEP